MPSDQHLATAVISELKTVRNTGSHYKICSWPKILQHSINVGGGGGGGGGGYIPLENGVIWNRCGKTVPDISRRLLHSFGFIPRKNARGVIRPVNVINV